MNKIHLLTKEKQSLIRQNEELKTTKENLENRITELLDELNIINSKKNDWDCIVYNLQRDIHQSKNKLNKIPKWIQKIFIK